MNTPDIPAEAVEAAARELAMELGHTVLDFENRRAAPNTVRIARRALTAAAAPYIAAQATADLLARLGALRDEWRERATDPTTMIDCDPVVEIERCADALDALLRGAK